MNLIKDDLAEVAYFKRNKRNTGMSALEKLKKLQAIQFRYKEEFDVDQRLRAGLSAQQVKEIIPEAVVEVDGYLMLEMNVLKEYVREAKKELKKINKKIG